MNKIKSVLKKIGQWVLYKLELLILIKEAKNEGLRLNALGNFDVANSEDFYARCLIDHYQLRLMVIKQKYEQQIT